MQRTFKMCILGLAFAASGWAQDGVASPAQRPREDPNCRTLLIQSWLIGKDFVPSDRAFQLVRLASVAHPAEPALAALWGEEAFRVASELPNSWNRLALQKNALIALSKVDPNRALELFRTLDAPVFEGEANLPEDLRADAATQIFNQVWSYGGTSSLNVISREAQNLGETGQYPYIAMSPIVRELARHNRTEAESLVVQATAFYRKGSHFDSEDEDFVEFYTDNRDWLSFGLRRQALNIVVDRLTKRADSERRAASLGQKAFRGDTTTGQGSASFQTRAEQLVFEILPLIREVDPDWAERLTRDRPQFSGAAEHATDIRHSESVVIEAPKLARPGELEALQHKGLEGTRLNRIELMAAKNPDEALRMAYTLTDPALRSMALSRVAVEYAFSAPDKSAKLLDEAKRGLPRTGKQADELAAMAALVEAAARTGNRPLFHAIFRDAAELGEELFTEDAELHPEKAAIFMTGFDQLSILIRAGIRVDVDETLAFVANLHTAVLKAHLMIDAAAAIAETRNSKSK